jgi:hypothetical protein
VPTSTLHLDHDGNVAIRIRRITLVPGSRLQIPPTGFSFPNGTPTQNDAVHTAFVAENGSSVAYIASGASGLVLAPGEGVSTTAADLFVVGNSGTTPTTVIQMIVGQDSAPDLGTFSSAAQGTPQEILNAVISLPAGDYSFSLSQEALTSAATFPIQPANAGALVAATQGNPTLKVTGGTATTVNDQRPGKGPLAAGDGASLGPGGALLMAPNSNLTATASDGTSSVAVVQIESSTASKAPEGTHAANPNPANDASPTP